MAEVLLTAEVNPPVEAPPDEVALGAPPVEVAPPVELPPPVSPEPPVEDSSPDELLQPASRSTATALTHAPWRILKFSTDLMGFLSKDVANRDRRMGFFAPPHENGFGRGEALVRTKWIPACGSWGDWAARQEHSASRRRSERDKTVTPLRIGWGPEHYGYPRDGGFGTALGLSAWEEVLPICCGNRT